MTRLFAPSFRLFLAASFAGGLIAWIGSAAAVHADDATDKPVWTELLAPGDLAKNWTTKGNWKQSADGVVKLEPRAGESGWTRYDSYLWANQQYQDFEIDFEWMVEKHGNSGFYFHVGDMKEPVSTGIEVQIYDSASHGPDHKLGDHDAGGIIPGVPPTKNAAKATGEWNKFLITSKGDKLTVRLNGEIVNEVDLTQGQLKSRPKTGHLGFQDHAYPLSLRNIRIRGL